ncbi:hypothetical protein CAOG_08986, partial [Capsaspora owczarzaki ATCC 30864]|uniref:hypothetical protein n=1 Tax=Capsaspora owczarzaki (strain ATCC 30864) TaxID=595528 RepID=UPI000352615F
MAEWLLPASPNWYCSRVVDATPATASQPTRSHPSSSLAQLHPGGLPSSIPSTSGEITATSPSNGSGNATLVAFAAKAAITVLMVQDAAAVANKRSAVHRASGQAESADGAATVAHIDAQAPPSSDDHHQDQPHHRVPSSNSSSN